MLDVALALVLVPLRVELVHLHRHLPPLHQIHSLAGITTPKLAYGYLPTGTCLRGLQLESRGPFRDH
jgi:hypothetical protein